jgi:hypothetical protein
MVTRNEVVASARRYINVQSWSPQVDEHAFSAVNPDHTFHSIYRERRQYSNMPYCYGGSDSVTRFLSRIQNSTCPGGRDRCGRGEHTFRKRGTKQWYDPAPRGLGYGYRVPRSLAGIDCSAFVSRCWGIARRSTTTLPQVCLQIDRREIKKGDILNRRGIHVRVFDEWVGARMRVYEASGSHGRVVHHVVNWDDRYTPYSPFPQFRLLSPTTCPLQESRPNFQVEVRGSGDVEVEYVSFDDVCLSPQKSGTNPVRITYTPGYELRTGEYQLTVKAINRVAGQSFVDSASWRFRLEV